jgi:hypothetical protein
LPHNKARLVLLHDPDIDCAVAFLAALAELNPCMSMAPKSFTLSPFDDRRCTLTFRGIAENCAGAAIALDRFIRS